MAKPRHPATDWLEYIALRLAEMMFGMFPVSWSYPTMRLIGDAIYFLSRRHRNRALEHLRRSFPDWPERRIRATARASMRSVAYLALEFLFTPRLIRPESYQRHIRLADMSETVRLLTERKSGLIFLTGHFGNFEIVSYTMASIGFPTYSVARSADNPKLQEYLLATRQKTGQRILDKRGATAEVPDLLADRQAVCFVADQDAGRRGLFVDFFGRPASTYKSFGLLAMQFDVPIIIGYGRRLKDDFRFEIGVARIIHPHEWAHRDDPLRWITQEYTACLERVVRTDPTQYFWAHRRWKHRPKGEPAAEGGIA